MTAARPMNDPHSVGIYVGGTKIVGAVVNLAKGTLMLRHQIPTDPGRGGDPALADVRQLSRLMTDEAERSGIAPTNIGLGVAELVDPTSQVFSDYLIKWKRVDVQAQPGDILPTDLNSDVRAAAMAEAKFGAGRAYRDFLCISLGTGVSGVLVQEGVPNAGSRGAALVIASGATRHHCPECGHVSTTVVEQIVSGPGIARAFGPDATGQTTLAAAHAGDSMAIRILDHTAAELGRVIALLVNSLDPAPVILGGGLGFAPESYFDALKRAILAGLWDGDQRPLPVLHAGLGPDAAIIGAAVTTLLHQEPAHRPHR